MRRNRFALSAYAFKHQEIGNGVNTMICDILKLRNVRLIDHVADWKDAIYTCTHALVEQGYITEKYPKAVIQITEEYGPYYVLCPNVALIHARPQDGVKKLQLAVTLLKQPVYFKDKDVPARLLITLAATDSKSHLEVMQQIAELLLDEERINRLLGAETAFALYQMFLD